MRYFIFLFTIVYSLSAFSQSQEFNLKYELVNLGKDVNSGYHEAAPVISTDGKTLYFFVTDHPENTYGKEGSQDIWYSRLNADGNWGPAEHLKSPLNEHHSNQVFTVLPDGNTLFIRGGRRDNTKGFSFTYRQGNGWSSPDEIKVDDFDKMNLGRFYGATMSSDRNYIILYFSEKANSSMSDLYLSKKMSNGDYSRPVKLPTNINTGRDEFGCFLGPDDKVLYFSSSRKDMGFGGADIYKTTRLDDSWMKWSDPVNMGEPINSSAFDGYFSIDREDNVFVAMAGKRIDGGNLDIFKLVPKKITINLKGAVVDAKTSMPLGAEVEVLTGSKVDTTLRANESNGTFSMVLPKSGEYKFKTKLEGYNPGSGSVSFGEVFNDTTVYVEIQMQPIKKIPVLSGVVFDMKTDEPVNATVAIKIKESDTPERKVKTKEGVYKGNAEERGWYVLSATAEGYLNATDSIEIAGGDIEEFTKDLYMIPIEVGSTVRLNHIYFDFDKTTLKSESFVELDKVVDFLNNNPTVQIEIAGHTDSKGSDDYNLNLSQGRAEAVVNYLIEQQIDSYRLSAKGYGETVPVDTNDTEEGRAENRRVEFTILSK